MSVLCGDWLDDITLLALRLLYLTNFLAVSCLVVVVGGGGVVLPSCRSVMVFAAALCARQKNPTNCQIV